MARWVLQSPLSKEWKEPTPRSRHQRNKGVTFIRTGRPDAVKAFRVGGY